MWNDHQNNGAVVGKIQDDSWNIMRLEQKNRKL